MTKPTRADYQLALQNPQTAFREPSLRSAQVGKNRLGLPSLMSGNFAVVCHLRSGQNAWAVRAFHRDVPGLQHRYNLISTYLETKTGPHSAIVGFRYVADGILVNGSWHPTVLMDWVPGVQLDRAIDDRIAQCRSLTPLADAWLELVQELAALGIAHGDLQHGNVLVDGDRMRLVDYDGMFVPTMAGMIPAERGHPNFQHPRRGSHGFNSTLDQFSSVLIYTALRALQHDTSLWAAHGMRADALLFREADLVDPDASRLFHDLRVSGDPMVRYLVSTLQASLHSGESPLPLPALLSRFVQAQSPALGSSTDVAGWWRQQRNTDLPEEEGQSGTVNEAIGAGWLRVYIPRQVKTGNSGPSQDSAAFESPNGVRPSWLKSNSAPLGSGRVLFVASRSGKTIHLTTCDVAKRISRKSLIAFDSIQHAYAAGYTACKVCKPQQLRQSLADSTQSGGAEDEAVSGDASGSKRWDVRKVQGVLQSTSVSPPPRPSERVRSSSPVSVGSQVRLQHSGGKNSLIRIVRAGLPAPTASHVTEDSPLGRALIGKHSGDVVVYREVGRWHRLTIVEVQP